MARLPVPGSDDGKWGQILNEYLSQSLDESGNLKPDAVSKSTIGLDKVDNTADLDKPVSVAVQSALDKKLTTSELDTETATNIASSTTATASSLTEKFATKVAPEIIGSSTHRARFNRIQGSNAQGGFTSYLTDSSGNPVAGGIVVRETGDMSEGTINWSHNGDSGYLIHLTAANISTGSAGGLMGIGLHSSVPAGTAGLVSSQKGAGIGIGINNTSTATWTGNGDANTGYAAKILNLGGVGLRADMGNFGYQSGHLIELHGYTGSSNGARVLTVQDQSNNEYLYIDPASKQLWLKQGGANSANDHRTTWETGNGVIQKSHIYSGTPGLFFSSQIRSQSNLLKLDVAQAAAIGSHTYQTAFTAQATGSGAAAIGFMGANPAARQTVSGSRNGNAALASLLNALSLMGLITDSTTA